MCREHTNGVDVKSIIFWWRCSNSMNFLELFDDTNNWNRSGIIRDGLKQMPFISSEALEVLNWFISRNEFTCRTWAFSSQNFGNVFKSTRLSSATQMSIRNTFQRYFVANFKWNLKHLHMQSVRVSCFSRHENRTHNRRIKWKKKHEEEEEEKPAWEIEHTHEYFSLTLLG